MNNPSETDPRLPETLGALMSLFGGVKRALQHELRDAATVPPMLLRVLQLCAQHAGITQQGLARLTGRDKGQVARIVKELLEQGLLLRDDHPDDRRSHCLRPTAAGRAAVRRFEQAEAAVAQWLLGELPATERRVLHRQLTALRERIDARLQEDTDRG